MYGVIFDELEKFVLEEIGQTGLSRIRNLTGRGGPQLRIGENLSRRRVGGEPPQLKVERTGPQSGVITYRCKRALCPLAKGITRGAAAHHHVDVTISEESCMLRGDPECRIEVSGET